MTSPHRSLQHSEAARFTRNGLAADAGAAAGVRGEFAGWLREEVGLPEDRICDVVLAVTEALTNAAEFAYLAVDPRGTVDLEVVHDPRRSALTAIVTDRGRWRPPDVLHSHLSRGRGIPLMHALADAAAIDVSVDGTTVRLRFDGVGPKPL